MGFLERSRSLRRKETPFMRKKHEDTTTTTQQSKDPNVTKDTQRPVQSAHSHKESVWKISQTSSKDSSRPRTANKAPVREMYSELPPPPSMESLTDSRLFKPSHGASRRMSMTPSPRNTAQRLTIHSNHSTPGIVSDSQRHPKRSMTTPIDAPLHAPKSGAKKDPEPVAPAKTEASAASRKEPHLRKSKSGTWRSFFSRKQSKPPVPDFNTADIAPCPVPPKAIIKSKDSAKSFSQSKASPKESTPASDPVPAVPAKDAKRLDRYSISVDKTRGLQKQTQNRAQFTKSLGDPSSLPQLKLENLSAMEPPPRSFARSPSAESAMSQYFDAASHTSGPSMPATPLDAPRQPRLDISIPPVEMERYSVMFEKLLKPQPTLMERRQTMLKQLDIPNQAPGSLAPEDPTLQRRATSPNLNCPTPRAARLNGGGSQVATPVALYRAGNAPRLLRSQTAPPGALTPSRSDFGQRTHAPSTTNNSSACSTHSPIWSDASQPETPASDTETFVSFDINGSEHDEDESDVDDDEDNDTEIVTYNAVAMSTTAMFKEPQWKHDTPLKPAPPIPPKAPGRCSPPAFELEQAAMIDRPHPPRTSSLDDTAAKRKTRSGPQIGIARQVSVVRRGSPGGLSVPSPAKAQSPSIVDPSAPVPVFSKQPLRPKLVDVRNRKSTLVVLDEA